MARMQVPETRYADAEGVSIAYQAFGEGERTTIGVPGFAQNIDLVWDEPHARRFFERVGRLCRIIHFDKRGTGLSDRTMAGYTLEERAADIHAVMDAEGVERAIISGFSEGGTLAAYFAATYPERTEALMLIGAWAVITRRDDHPWMRSKEELLEGYKRAQSVWGQGKVICEVFAPSMRDDDAFRRWAARYERQSINPSVFLDYAEVISEIDIRALLPSISVPTIVIHAEGDRSTPIECGRYIADHIPNAKFVTLPGEDHAIWFNAQDAYIDAMARFITGDAAPVEPDRVLATVLFTDIVDSTAQTMRVGDDDWRMKLDHHDRIVHEVVSAFKGRPVKSTGDGLLATFDGPSRALRAAMQMINRISHETGLIVRIGLHCGEIERRGDDIAGIAVHIASRVQALAPAGGITVSRTVKDLVAGTNLRFTDRGPHELKGIGDAWELFDVVRG